MKTKTWILLIGAVLLVCMGLSVWLLGSGGQAQQAQIWSEGELKHTLLLSVDQTVTVESGLGTNVVTVRDGKIAVTQADCPDHYCMDRGFCSGGAQIVCLPNRLVIKFVGDSGIDGMAG
ncbi:MAG: NusG domain II-containing protein [Oscillospiraceae bacterium]|nr:NusG domain II-containing protein [Oscillospiraceae bacterium]